MHLARECWHVVASDVTGYYFQFLVAIYRHLYLYINPLVTDPLYLVYSYGKNFVKKRRDNKKKIHMRCIAPMSQ